MSKRILVVAPHPDDEVLGCGGILKKYSDAGNKTFVLVVTRGTPKLYSDEKVKNVRQEARHSHTILGVTETIFLDFHAPYLDLVSHSDIAREISKNIIFYKIDTLFLPHGGDIHHDHKIVFNAGLVAARPIENQLIRRIFTYETLSETEWAAPRSDDAFIPTHYVNISDSFTSKIEAMRCFTSQLRDFPNSRSIKSIEALANMRGSTVGFTHAEAFMTIRVIED